MSKYHPKPLWKKTNCGVSMCGHKGSKAAIESMKESHIRSQSVWKYSIFFNHSHKCTDSPVPLPAPHHKRASWGGSGGALGQKRSNQHLDFYVNLIILWSYKVFVLALHMEMKTSVLPQGSSCVLSSMTGLKQHLCALKESWMPNSFRKQTNKKIPFGYFNWPRSDHFQCVKLWTLARFWTGLEKKGWDGDVGTMRLIPILS